MSLPDGRNLEYHEQGDPDGIPVIYIHGTPDSGATLGSLENKLGKQLGIRWIGPNRPGIGASTFYPNRRVLDYHSDIKALTEHLGLERYCILGTSGGTGYTLACAQHLPRNKLGAVGICAGIGPWEAGLEGQSEINSSVMQIWKDSPEVILDTLSQIYVPAASTSDYAAIETLWRGEVEKWFTGADQEQLREESSIQAAVRTFRQVYLHGTAAHAKDMRLNTQNWGFEIQDVDYEGLMLWYGSKDENTSPQMGRYMAERLKGCEYKEYEGRTHFTIWTEDLVREFVGDLLKRFKA